VPVGSGAASKICRNARGRWERAAEYFESESKNGLSCKEEIVQRSLFSSVPAGQRRLRVLRTKARNQTAPLRLRLRKIGLKAHYLLPGG
jgi:hypothetical protein